ncbi:MAG: DNA polymerase III subunit epsilon [Cytophagales bacterium]|nr:MAG: DNA polymerase III subunit epsilon [Cytophagales bacterium]
MYAIIDIETTGGKPIKSNITEIAIIIHDGEKVIDKFTTLLNPQCHIPYFITNLTGISNDMVHDAPKFHEVAKQIVEITKDCVFVAHNVNFDYSFVKAAFKNLGYDYNRKTLCTVKLSRKTFPGLASYSLGNLCKHFEIQNKAQHRAMGDAEATIQVFEKILLANPDLLSSENIKSEIKKNIIPIELDESIFNKIEDNITGVYYFHNTKGEVLYIGKSINIKKRILQHFAVSAKGNRRSLALKNEISDITYENTGNELIALLLESAEIKKLKPKYNLAQKKTKQIPFYCLYSETDKDGYLVIKIDKIREDTESIFMADSLAEVKDFLHNLIDKNQLCLSKCDLHKTGGACFNHQIEKCKGACCGIEPAESYNLRVQKVLLRYSFQNKSFFLIDKGRNVYEKSIVCIENGIYKGFGYVDSEFQLGIEEMKDCIKKYNHNRDIQLIIKRFDNKKVQKIPFTSVKEEIFYKEL